MTTDELVVLRPFPGPNGSYFARGEHVKADGFRSRNLKALVDRRYLAPVQSVAPAEHSADPQTPPKGKPGRKPKPKPEAAPIE